MTTVKELQDLIKHLDPEDQLGVLVHTMGGNTEIYKLDDVVIIDNKPFLQAKYW